MGNPGQYTISLEHPEHGPFQTLGIPVQLSRTPGRAQGPAPRLGEHTEEVLSKVAGYNPQELESLRQRGIIATRGQRP